MAVIGVLARVEVAERDCVVASLGRIEGVTPFLIDEPGRIGLVVEADTLEAAHKRLVDEIDPTPGVLGTWPVFVHAENETAESTVWDVFSTSVASEGEMNE
ncbi:MAG: chaperone NapD [Planctomycetes bacterium]|nr:chaperone NapD [Planctomycetota bacterium]